MNRINLIALIGVFVLSIGYSYGQNEVLYLPAEGSIENSQNCISKFGKSDEETIRLEKSLLYELEGNIGIDNAKPKYKLDVGGDLSIKGIFNIDKDLSGNSQIVFSGNDNRISLVDKKLEIGYFADPTKKDQWYKALSIDHQTVTLTHLVLPLNGASDGYILKTDNTGSATWTNPATIYDNDWEVDGDDMYSAVSGNVGIGTSTPETSLDVISHASTYGIANFHNDFEGAKIQLYGGTTGGVIRNMKWGKTLEFATHQASGTYNDNQLFLSGNGNVGIGKDNPNYTLDVGGHINFSGDLMYNGTILPLPRWRLNGSNDLYYDMGPVCIGTDDPYGYTLAHFVAPYEHNGLLIETDQSSGNLGWAIKCIVQNSNANGIVVNDATGTNFKVRGNGKTYINNKLTATSIEVKTDVWSDYVFDVDYKLLPLNELENYINENNHLPDVPSTEEVVKTGINLGEMDALLLKKIEELTLYVIDLKKENDILKGRINDVLEEAN